jgi:hypothetical protein
MKFKRDAILVSLLLAVASGALLRPTSDPLGPTAPTRAPTLVVRGEPRDDADYLFIEYNPRMPDARATLHVTRQNGSEEMLDLNDTSPALLPIGPGEGLLSLRLIRHEPDEDPVTMWAWVGRAHVITGATLQEIHRKLAEDAA